MLELYPLISLLFAILAGSQVLKLGVVCLPEGGGRYSSLDGLRGFLALAVFFHHYLITYYWKQTGTWTHPPSILYENFGRVGVSLFFMITGFLFIGKLLDDNRPNWYAMFRSRLFRILPLYLFALLIISIVVFLSQNTDTSVLSSNLAKDYLRWFLFIGGPINDFSDTSKVIAGVHWTLKYEWLFYLSLPIIFLVLRSGFAVIFGLGALVIAFNIFPVSFFGLFDSTHLIFFLCGGVVAKSVRKKTEWIRFADSRISSFVATSLLLLSLFHSEPLSLSHALVLLLFFALVAHGNTLFGLLTLHTARVLGEISYSIYLLHGIVLYLAFTNIFSDYAAQASLSTYMLAMPLCTVIVVLISAVSFKWIEAPMISLGKSRRPSGKLACNSTSTNQVT